MRRVNGAALLMIPAIAMEERRVAEEQDGDPCQKPDDVNRAVLQARQAPIMDRLIGARPSPGHGNG